MTALRRFTCWLAFGALALSASAEDLGTLVGSAEVRMSGSARGSARIVFAAAAEPRALRLEVIQAGSVAAVVHATSDKLRVLVPGARPLLHEAEPTREAFESALGLPACFGELLFALRAGHAPAPSCGEEGAVVVTGRGGRVVGLRRESRTRGRPELLRFSRFREGRHGEWPGRAVLETSGGVATVHFGTLRPHDREPLGLEPELIARSRPVGADELRRALGLEERDSP